MQVGYLIFSSFAMTTESISMMCSYAPRACRQIITVEGSQHEKRKYEQHATLTHHSICALEEIVTCEHAKKHTCVHRYLLKLPKGL